MSVLWNGNRNPVPVAQQPLTEPVPVVPQVAIGPKPTEAPRPSQAVSRQRPPAPRPHQIAQQRRPIERAPVAATVVSQAPVQDEIAMKLETEDPNVIIIWLASPKGERR